MTATQPWRPNRLALEVAPIVLLLGLLLWDIRTLLEPLIVYPLLVFLLWPVRANPLGLRALLVVTALFSVWLVATNMGILTPFLLAFGVAYLLAPAVEWLVRRGAPRGVAAAMMELPFILLLVGLILLLIPQVEQQLLDFVARIPDVAKRLADWLLQLRDRLAASGGGSGIISDEQVARLRNLQASDLVSLVSSKWNEIASSLWSVVLGIGQGFKAGFSVVLTMLGYFVVAPVVTFYLLLAWPTITRHIEELVPPARRPAIFGFLREYDLILGRFVRGQVTEAALVAVLTSVGLFIVGFPAAILMGVIAGLGNLIPQVGLFLSIVPGLLLALVQPSVGASLVKLIAVFAVVQIIDGQVTGPRIVGGAVGLSPVWMMIAVLVFGNLFGIVGMFLAVPLAALVKMFVLRGFKHYTASAMYGTTTVNGER